MKLDPGMHIGIHLVSFGKSGVTRGRRTGSWCGRLRLNAVQAHVLLGPGWPAARDLPGSSMATTTRGPACEPKTPWVLERPRGARRFAPKKGDSAASRWRRGFSMVTRPASQHDRHGSTTHLDK
jgi:hypothetical protein